MPQNLYCRNKLGQIMYEDQFCREYKGQIFIQDASGYRFYYEHWQEALSDYCRNRKQFYTAMKGKKYD
jgi:hypothetical protein